jgi:hypothetical protein
MRQNRIRQKTETRRNRLTPHHQAQCRTKKKPGNAGLSDD